MLIIFRNKTHEDSYYSSQRRDNGFAQLVTSQGAFSSVVAIWWKCKESYIVTYKDLLLTE